MRKRTLTLAAGLIGALLLAGCTGDPVAEETTRSPRQSVDATPSPSASTSPSSSDASVEGTVVRFTAGSETLDVTLGEDSPATLDYEGSPGSDPEDGDLIYFVPWGNIGFYYDTEGIEYSDQTLHLGTYDATEQELARFEDEETRVEVVE